MPARNAKQWETVPGKLSSGEYVDSRIYSDREIFEEEITKIFRKVWMPVCHESELPDPYSFRTMTVAREPVMVVRGADNQIRAFLNVCPHRGNMLENRPSGSFEEAAPSGAPKHITCMFHAWQFDMKGNCAHISRASEGYQDRLCLLYTSPSPRDATLSRMPSSA